MSTCVFDWGWLMVFRVKPGTYAVWLFNNRFLIRRKVRWWAQGR